MLDYLQMENGNLKLRVETANSNAGPNNSNNTFVREKIDDLVHKEV
jgi:hypothetical protein